MAVVARVLRADGSLNGSAVRCDRAELPRCGMPDAHGTGTGPALPGAYRWNFRGALAGGQTGAGPASTGRARRRESPDASSGSGRLLADEAPVVKAFPSMSNKNSSGGGGGTGTACKGGV
jgi:hypothetical protein